ncbi:hypothetical protein MMJ63_26915, partial [Bacillus vallismortis]|nr:hypothetical protein [Bacillus vallismortis]
AKAYMVPHARVQPLHSPSLFENKEKKGVCVSDTAPFFI